MMEDSFAHTQNTMELFHTFTHKMTNLNLNWNYISEQDQDWIDLL